MSYQHKQNLMVVLALLIIFSLVFQPIVPTHAPQLAHAFASSSPNKQAGSATEDKGTSSTQGPNQLAKLPLRFEQNVGQVDSAALYLAKGAGYTMFLAQSEQVLVLNSKQRSNLIDLTSNSKVDTTAVLRFHLNGSNASPQLVVEGEVVGKSNYFLGSDATAWHTDIPNYARVVYKNVYPGVDLAYYGGAEGKLEHDYIVAAGSDPNQIHEQVSGAEKIEVVNGELLLHTTVGEVPMCIRTHLLVGERLVATM